MPFNLLLRLLSIPIYYICMKNKHKMNEVLMRIAYLPISILIIFIIFSLAFFGGFLVFLMIPFFFIFIPYFILKEWGIRCCMCCMCCLFLIYPMILTLVPFFTFILLLWAFVKNSLTDEFRLKKRIDEPVYTHINQAQFTLIVETLKKIEKEHRDNCENLAWPSRCYVKT